MKDKKVQDKRKSKKPNRRKRTKGNAARSPRSRRSGVGLLDPAYFKALSSPLRVAILTILVERRASPKELSKELRVSLPRASYHVVVLQKVGLIKEVDRVQRRGAVEHYYEAVHATVLPPDLWTELPVQYRRTIPTRILKEFLDDARGTMEANRFRKDSSSLSLTPLVVNPVGAKKIERLIRDFDKALLEIQREASDGMKDRRNDSTAKSSKRLVAEGGDHTISMTVFLTSFESIRGVKDNVTATSRRRW